MKCFTKYTDPDTLHVCRFREAGITGVQQVLGVLAERVVAKVQIPCMTYETLVTVYGVGCLVETRGCPAPGDLETHLTHLPSLSQEAIG